MYILFFSSEVLTSGKVWVRWFNCYKKRKADKVIIRIYREDVIEKSA